MTEHECKHLWQSLGIVNRITKGASKANRIPAIRVSVYGGIPRASKVPEVTQRSFTHLLHHHLCHHSLSMWPFLKQRHPINSHIQILTESGMKLGG